MSAMMRPLLVLAALSAAVPVAGAVPVAPQAPNGPEVSLPFFGQDGLSDYRIDGTRGIYLLSQTDGTWVYLHVQPDCPRLAQVDGFSVDTGGSGELDNKSAIIVGGQRCLLSSVTASPPPPGRKTLK
jgi:hypothetical protein